MKSTVVTFARTISIAGILFAGSNAMASTTGDYVTSQNYVIDAAQSTVTYNPGILTFGTDGVSSNPSSATYNASGTFTLNINHFSWSTPSDWVQFTNSAVVVNGLTPQFQLPLFYSELTSPTQFSGNDGPCSGPRDPAIFCSGFQNGPSSSLSGQIQGGKLIFSGYQPNENYLFSGGYNYSFVATVVPVPATFWLFASALGFFSMSKRAKH
jgi:hypothetical protein